MADNNNEFERLRREKAGDFDSGAATPEEKPEAKTDGK